MFTLRLTAGRLILSQKISVRILEGDPEITFPLSYPGDGAALLMRNEAGSSPAEGANSRYFVLTFTKLSRQSGARAKHIDRM